MNEVCLLGDCLEVLKDVPDNSIDSVVTDPPYGLSFMGKKWDYNVPSVDIWKEVLRVLKPGGHLLAFGGTRTYHRLVVAIEDAGFEIRDQIQWLYGSGFPKSHNIKEGKFKGFGTALKPANEPICLARKSLDGTVAQNLEKWGVGGLNIDESRIEGVDAQEGRSRHDGGLMQGASFQMPDSESSMPAGRWPANLLFDETAAQMLDEQSGMSKSSAAQRNNKPSPNLAMSGTNLGHISQGHADSGGASRFFYCAKSSKSERNAGLEGIPEKGWKDQGFRDNESTHLSPRAGAGRTSSNANHHPTVKPIKLMEYLCKLITPPGGVILDPFMGSGSTGVAAKKAGFGFLGIEMNEEYITIAEKRIEAA